MQRTDTWFAKSIAGLLFVLAVSLCLFGNIASLREPGFFSNVAGRCDAVFGSAQTQWMIMLCLVAYLVAFIVFDQIAANRFFLRPDNPNLWLAAFLLIAIPAYFLNYPEAARSTQALTFIAGIAIAKAICAWRSRWQMHADHQAWLGGMVIPLFIASVWHPETFTSFQYHGQKRWSGPWSNPNTFGLLMGAGIVLIFGSLLAIWKFKQAGMFVEKQPLSAAENGNKIKLPKGKTLFWLFGSFILAAIFILRGELKSYSRGAWLGTFFGLCYLGFSALNFYHSTWKRRFRKQWAILGLIFISMAVISFWQLRHTEHAMTRRALSVANKNDFSWRNRLQAWKSSLRMIAERPGFGFGWNQPELMYKYYHRTNKMDEGLAIQMNDYFMLGTTLGLPALIFLTGYVWLRLTGNTWPKTGSLTFDSSSGSNDSENRTLEWEQARLDWLQTTSRAAAIVLLIGFWFDGGLFKLETAALFWLLLELGAAGTQRGLSPRSPQNLWFISIVFLTFAGVLCWAKGDDSLRRIPFRVQVPGRAAVNGLVVRPKHLESSPVVIYLHGTGGTLLSDGESLTHLAELGMAAVSIEYEQDDPSAFEAQFSALLRYLPQQSWAGSNATAWVGFSLGAQRELEFLLQHPENQPQLLMRLSGGWVPDLDQFLTASDRIAPFPIQCPVLLLHGDADEIFPAEDVRNLAKLLGNNNVPVNLARLPTTHSLDPNRGLAFRLTAEYCRSILAPKQPYSGIEAKRGLSLWFYLTPAIILLCLCFHARQKLRSDHKEKTALPVPMSFEKATRLGAVILALVAVAETMLHLLPLHLPVTTSSLNVARRFLIQPKMQADLDWLAERNLWQDKQLGILLEHLELTRYNRDIIDWEIDEQLYRNFVLCPLIDSSQVQELGWRRMLWEFFYPRIRKAQTTQEAAEIVVRCLRERVSITRKSIPVSGVETIWKHQIADQNGFETIYVAALRSVGVPARLDSSNKTEFWNGTIWQSAPRPVIGDSGWR